MLQVNQKKNRHTQAFSHSSLEGQGLLRAPSLASLSSDSAPDEMPESVAQIMDGVEGRRVASLQGRLLFSTSPSP